METGILKWKWIYEISRLQLCLHKHATANRGKKSALTGFSLSDQINPPNQMFFIDVNQRENRSDLPEEKSRFDSSQWSRGGRSLQVDNHLIIISFSFIIHFHLLICVLLVKEKQENCFPSVFRFYFHFIPSCCILWIKINCMAVQATSILFV